MSLEIIAAVIFFMTYAGIALGSIPGLAIDRTGSIHSWFCPPNSLWADSIQKLPWA
jgi:hypothetical protein